MNKQKIGVIGLAVMGKNLALNIADHGYTVSVYNRSPEKTKALTSEAGSLGVFGFISIEDFVQSLELPRKIILMVKAGDAVDDTIRQLIPHVSKGDILIDGGNSFYMDTIRRYNELRALDIRFIGAGISGGEEGARKGPAIMPGGDRDAYNSIAPILTDISAKVDGDPCCAYIGPSGSGHFVKMVHNGIEYADMQLICEAYLIMKKVLHMSVPEMQETFCEWNKGELNSYLIEITSDILEKADPDTGHFMVDMILDVAGQKGTGKWTSQVALDMGVATPTITEAVFLRYLSAVKDERTAASTVLSGPSNAVRKLKISAESIRKALYASKICAYAQGFALLRAASENLDWQLEPGRIAMIFRGGCIIRAQFLSRIKDGYDNQPKIANLLLDDYFRSIAAGYQNEWREVVMASVEAGIPVPGFSSALCYYDSYRSNELPMNLLQAQRDYFGAHTYQRVDKEGFYHTQW